MRILVIVDQMALGGAGRVASIMLQGLAQKGHAILLETDTSKGILYDVPECVEIKPIQYTAGQANIYGRIKHFVRRIRGHRKCIKSFKPDIIISYLPPVYVDALLAKIGTGIPIVVSDHTAMSRNLGKWINFVRHHLYGLASCATILTEKDKRFLGKRVKSKEVVYNPLTFDPISNVCQKGRRKNILCVGRVMSWNVKGFDRIIKLWGSISKKYPEWTLEIAGPGDQKHIDKLMEIARESGCADSIKFLGNIKDIQTLYQQSSIFALPSRVEGFPMALIEAMSQGCACVSFDLDGAISEIANDEEDCMIVPDNDLDAFSDRLEQLLKNIVLRQQIAQASVVCVERYSKDIFIAKWESIISRNFKRKKLR